MHTPFPTLFSSPSVVSGVRGKCSNQTWPHSGLAAERSRAWTCEHRIAVQARWNLAPDATRLLRYCCLSAERASTSKLITEADKHPLSLFHQSPPAILSYSTPISFYLCAGPPTSGTPPRESSGMLLAGCLKRVVKRKYTKRSVKAKLKPSQPQDTVVYPVHSPKQDALQKGIVVSPLSGHLILFRKQITRQNAQQV